MLNRSSSPRLLEAKALAMILAAAGAAGILCAKENNTGQPGEAQPGTAPAAKAPEPPGHVAHSYSSGDVEHTDPAEGVMPGFLPMIDDMTRREMGIYTPFFLDAGLTKEQVAELALRRKNIHLRANAAQDFLLRLSRERVNYDEKVKEMLGPGEYEHYLKFERYQRVIWEWDHLRVFSLEHPETVTDYKQEIEDAIAKTGAFTTDPSHGPYDPAPRPSASIKEAIQFIEERIEKLRNSSDALLKSIRGTLPDPTVEQIRKYYDSAIHSLQQQIARAENPPKIPKTIPPELLKKAMDNPSLLMKSSDPEFWDKWYAEHPTNAPARK